MRWIGIDPGLRTTGFGVIDVDGQKLNYVASGTIESGDPAKGLPERLGALYAGLKEVLETYHPESAAIEEVFLNVNPRSTLMLGQARGAVIAALVSEKLPVAEYSALRVKQAIVGTGRAAKPQVQEMVKRLLRLNRAPGTDASDALGVAICAAHHAQMLEGEAARIDEIRRQRPEHEGVIGVGRVAKGQCALRHLWTINRPRTACHGKACPTAEASRGLAACGKGQVDLLGTRRRGRRRRPPRPDPLRPCENPAAAGFFVALGRVQGADHAGGRRGRVAVSAASAFQGLFARQAGPGRDQRVDLRHGPHHRFRQRHDQSGRRRRRGSYHRSDDRRAGRPHAVALAPVRGKPGTDRAAAGSARGVPSARPAIRHGRFPARPPTRPRP